MLRLLSVSGLALICLTVNVRPAYSQIPAEDLTDIEAPFEDETVLGRARPEYSPIGIPLGAFRAYPTANFGAVGSFDCYSTWVDRAASCGSSENFRRVKSPAPCRRRVAACVRSAKGR